MNNLWLDFRYALRQLRRSPGFTLTAVLTLALGIGATTAIFTLVYDAMLRPLPFTHPDRLVVMGEQVAEFHDIYPELPVNANHFVNWQRNSQTIQSMAVLHDDSMPMGTGDHPLQVSVLKATPGIFSVLDTQPRLGHAFTAAEAHAGHDRVVVLMDGLWRAQFHSDPDIPGKTIILNGFPFTVIGVMPRGFRVPFVSTIGDPNSDRAHPAEALVPLAFSNEQLQEVMGDFDYTGLARLNPGVSAAQANAEIDALQHTISAGLPANAKGTLSAMLTPLQEALVGHNREPLLILLAAVAGLLLVGCINIANLLLARATDRRQQTAVSAALGASRTQMLRAAMREPIALAVAGGALGILLAASIVPAMQQYMPPALDFRGPLHLDWVGAGCAVLLVTLATVLAGIAPALMVSRTAPQQVLHSESRLATESQNSKRVRGTLVAVEVAVSVALVLTTGLLTTSLIKLLRVDRGFDQDSIVTATVDLPAGAYSTLQSRSNFYREVLDRLRRLPGVQAAGLTSQLPLAGDKWIDLIRVPGDARPFTQLPTEHFRWISPGYFESLHLPLIAGRRLSASDEGKRVAVISDLTARTLWPGADPVGRQFSRAGLTEDPFTVIGVVKDARTISLAHADPMMVYMPYWYRCDSDGGILVRTRQDPAALAGAIRKAVWSVNADVSIPVMRTLGGVVADSVQSQRFEMDLLLLFAVSALLLAGLGIYGVITYSVVQRRREIGLRIALGAQRAGVYRLVLHDGLLPVAAGAVAGIALAFVSARLVSSLLFEVSPYDPMLAAGAVSILLAVGTVACLLPARHAASIEPMQALRSE
jgi:predicted permease